VAPSGNSKKGTCIHLAFWMADVHLERFDEAEKHYAVASLAVISKRRRVLNGMFACE